MTNEEEVTELRRKCQAHNPAKLRLYREDELVREVPAPANRKKWLHVMRVVFDLRSKWSSVELCDRHNSTLDVFTPTPAAAAAPAPGRIGGFDAGELGGNAETMRMMIAAQREVLTYRERDNGAAMQAMVNMMERVTQAVGALADVHARTLEAQRQQAQVEIARATALATATIAPPAPAADDEDGDELESMKMLKALAPQLAEKLAGGLLEKFGPMLVSMLAPSPAPRPSNVIDVNSKKVG